MKKICNKISSILKSIFGYGITICLFAGVSIFVGYVIALFTGGQLAAQICEIIYKTIVPCIIEASTILILLGLIAMYLNGEVALTSGKKKKKEKTNAVS